MNPVSVSDLTAHITSLLEGDDLLRDVWVLAEVSSWNRAASGHIYFSLKDGGSVVSSVMWRGNTYRHSWLPGPGDQVLAHGYVGVYPQRGSYQLYVDEIRPAGRGQLYARFEALKEKLAAQGLFEVERKRAVVPVPRLIAIVTSPSAAAFQDVLRVLRQRWPLAEAVLFPTQVQGAAAPDQIAQALAAANRHTREPDGGRRGGSAPLAPDTILLVRGGGSIEDLWAFNEEPVAYAIADSAIPVVTGVGHETDFTIADFVADLRAPTPTGAAVEATPSRAEVLEGIRSTRSLLAASGMDAVAERRAALEQAARRLERSAPLRQLDVARQRLDDAAERLRRALAQGLLRRRERVALNAARLDSLSPSNVLTRGYSIVHKASGEVVSSPGQAEPGERLSVRAAGGAYPVLRESG